VGPRGPISSVGAELMENGIHFIAGLPRSGSTLLSAILRQNPKLHAGISSPVAALFSSLLNVMSARSEWVDLFDDEQRENVLRAAFHAYYQKISATKLVFDTNRLWCAKMEALARLFPNARVIVCVRELAWVVDSFERLVRKNPFLMSRMYSSESATTVYTRTSHITGATGVVGMAWDAIHEAFYGDHSGRLVVIDYEALAREPKRTMEFIYDAIALPYFDHDFENVTYQESGEFDVRVGIPGLHLVTGKVHFVDRPTVLPPDVFQRFANRNFWRNPRSNPRKVRILLPSALASPIRPTTAVPEALRGQEKTSHSNI
jgi:sulfotransferase